MSAYVAEFSLTTTRDEYDLTNISEEA